MIKVPAFFHSTVMVHKKLLFKKAFESATNSFFSPVESSYVLPFLQHSTPRSYFYCFSTLIFLFITTASMALSERKQNTSQGLASQKAWMSPRKGPGFLLVMACLKKLFELWKQSHVTGKKGKQKRAKGYGGIPGSQGRQNLAAKNTYFFIFKIFIQIGLKKFMTSLREQNSKVNLQ